MNANDESNDTQTPADAERKPTPGATTMPRGNQAPEQEWVERGEEQLEKVSGN